MGYNTTLERIIGGKEVVSHIPWQVSIQQIESGTWSHFCGGTILNQYTILSAAHCFYEDYYRKGVEGQYMARFNPKNYRIVAGTHDLTNSQSTHLQVLYTQGRHMIQIGHELPNLI